MLTAEVVSEFKEEGADPVLSKFGEKITIIGKDRKGELSIL